MSSPAQRARDLLSAYGLSLDRQILGRGSCLARGDQELWRRVEAELRDGDARDAHCLGLDPLSVMEESLKAAAAATAAPAKGPSRSGRGPRGGRPRGGGLQGLDKAFQVLEQAALNLHLGPWRDEYKVVKMYSGTFTHVIKPVLSLPQIENLFGLLGYQLSSAHHEQLLLRTLRVGAAPDELLRLSCAFYLAHCECRLLLDALGKHAGDAQWELGLVRERQRGNGVQVALESSKKSLRAHQALMEALEVEVDLYTDLSGGQAAAAPADGEDQTWPSQNRASPPGVQNQEDGAASREQVCVSTLSCQIGRTAPPEAALGSSGGKETRSGPVEPDSLGLCEGEVDRSCVCLQTPHLFLNRCVDCGALHHVTCAALKLCLLRDHVVESWNQGGAAGEPGGAAPPGESLRTASPTGAALSAMSLREDPASMLLPPLNPIAFHDCCDLTRLDPQVLCRSCAVFHSASCRDLRELCHAHHAVAPLGACVCGKPCSRKPLVLCRYCGNEYCRDCWYRSPVVCACGRTFDQSSSV